MTQRKENTKLKTIMGRMIRFILTVGFCFLLGFSLSRFKETGESFLMKSSPMTPFKPTLYPIKNQSFVFILVGRNNGQSVEKTLYSIFSQNYEKYRLVYVDDGSDDGSYEHAHDLIVNSGYAEKVQLMQSNPPQGVIGNLFQAIHSCQDHEIVILLNEEDLLAHEWVLQKLNQYYANPDLWLTIGSYLRYPTFEKETLGECFNLDLRDTPSNQFHLKTFYAALFKKIKQSDLCFQNEFMPNSMDAAYMIPLLEMAKGHCHQIEDILYLVANTPEKDPMLHALCEVSLKQREPYIAQEHLFEQNTGDL